MSPEQAEALAVEMSDYHDGSMKPAERAAFEKRLADEPAVRAEYEKFKAALDAVSGLHRMAAPDKLADEVAETIHRRSAGRFFGPKTLGDRLPWTAIAVLSLAVLLLVYVAMRLSVTGAVHEPLERKAEPPDAAPAGAVPRP